MRGFTSCIRSVRVKKYTLPDRNVNSSLAAVNQSCVTGSFNSSTNFDRSGKVNYCGQTRNIYSTPVVLKDDHLELLSSFANLDHTRNQRTGFPEAVFAQGKTPHQISTILDDMAANINNNMINNTDKSNSPTNAILATRVDKELYEQIAAIELKHGSLEYHETARIITMIPTMAQDSKTENDSAEELNSRFLGRVVVASAGTTDLFVAEEAAITLEATGQVEVDRVYDAGVAGLHRILKALPRLQHPDVKCILVCAGMDGALPSVVGGLVSVPVIAIPTSVGYGAAFQGVSALLTMLNTCSPGVGVVNIDNGFGGAALAYKFLHNSGNVNSK